jgi:hypothetical protein
VAQYRERNTMAEILNQFADEVEFVALNRRTVTSAGDDPQLTFAPLPRPGSEPGPVPPVLGSSVSEARIAPEAPTAA